MKIERHQPLDEEERYVATFGRSEKLNIDSDSILAVTDTETGSYTCLQDLAGTFYEREVVEALGRHRYGDEMDDSEPVEDRYHSEAKLEIIAEGLEPSEAEDELVEENDINGAFKKLEAGHPEMSPDTDDSSIARKRQRHYDHI